MSSDQCSCQALQLHSVSCTPCHASPGPPKLDDNTLWAELCEQPDCHPNHRTPPQASKHACMPACQHWLSSTTCDPTNESGMPRVEEERDMVSETPATRILNNTSALCTHSPRTPFAVSLSPSDGVFGGCIRIVKIERANDGLLPSPPEAPITDLITLHWQAAACVHKQPCTHKMHRTLTKGWRLDDSHTKVASQASWQLPPPPAPPMCANRTLPCTPDAPETPPSSPFLNQQPGNHAGHGLHPAHPHSCRHTA